MTVRMQPAEHKGKPCFAVIVNNGKPKKFWTSDAAGAFIKRILGGNK